MPCTWVRAESEQLGREGGGHNNDVIGIMATFSAAVKIY
jgi:hypothetical protein